MTLRGRRSTIRLALTYLGIIMTLCIGFSLIFFSTSSGSLQLNVQHTANNEATGPRVGKLDMANGQSIPGAPTNVDDELAKRLGAVRQNLARRLIALNVGALVFGGALSYYLARRTLRPIEQAMAAQARFSSDASHELRTPLAALRTRGEVALRDPFLNLTQAKAAIKNGVTQAIRLERLADGLLKLSRSDGQPLTLGPIALQEVVSKAIEQLQHKAHVKHVNIKHDVPPSLYAVGEADSLAQVVCILLDNAIKHSSAGNSVCIHAKKTGATAALTVQDNGAGIGPADLPHIFERFYQADRSRRHDDHSYGLGLAIASQLIAQNRGTIAVQSELGKGSTFTIKLPLA
ncbi:MAG TPA: HAMP domain-containing sensor histidine kinase [Candidatus Saccharimonadales bacterium]|nr:HAMP domain-containing sensor histidine kinase [Candidatus Saccharimonadales bacterium]